MLEKEKSLLVVTDVQGKLAQLMFQKEILFRNIVILIDGCKILGIPILWVEQYPQGLGPTVPEVASHLEGYEPLPKKCFSSLKNQRIGERFEELGRSQVIMTGIEAHVCIYQTSLDLLARGIEVHVVQDAVSSRTEENKTIGIGKIVRAGGHVTSVETVLFELLNTAEGDAFKKILALVR